MLYLQETGQSIRDLDLVGWHKIESCSWNQYCTTIAKTLPTFLQSTDPDLSWLISHTCCDGTLGPAALYLLPVLLDLLAESATPELMESLHSHRIASHHVS